MYRVVFKRGNFRWYFICKLLVSCFFTGCEKPQQTVALDKTTENLSKPTEALSEEKKVDPTDKPSDVPLEKQVSFVEEYKKWEARALEQFPSLGVAGSPMNLGLINYVADARKRSAPELEMPSYVYIYACRVAVQIDAQKPVASAPGKSPAYLWSSKPTTVPATTKDSTRAVFPALVEDRHWVKEYKRKDGTVVHGHWAANSGKK